MRCGRISWISSRHHLRTASPGTSQVRLGAPVYRGRKATAAGTLDSAATHLLVSTQTQVIRFTASWCFSGRSLVEDGSMVRNPIAPTAHAFDELMEVGINEPSWRIRK
jgi:hypothetical protein